MFFRLLFIFLISSFIANGQALDSILNASNTQAPPLNSDRPGQTYNASTVGKGALVTQLGLDVGGHRLVRFDLESNAMKGVVEMRYGLGKKLELGASYYGFSNNIDYDTLKEAIGLENAYGLNVRYNLLSKEKTSLGLLADQSFVNTSKETFGVTSLKFLYSTQLSNTFSLSGNLGYVYVGSGRSGAMTYTLNLGAGLFDDFGIYIENFGLVSNSGSDIWIDSGLWYLINSNVQLDFILAKGFNNNVQDYLISLGLTWRIINPK